MLYDALRIDYRDRSQKDSSGDVIDMSKPDDIGKLKRLANAMR